MSERRLVLLRHAKAEPPTGVADFDRPLTADGHADSAAAGAWLARSGYLPDLVICSPARRARQTWHGVALGMAESRPVEQTAARAPVVRYEAGIYQGGASDLLSLLQTSAADEAATVLVVGHNPAISELSALLDPAPSRDRDGLQTSGLAIHEVSGAWRDLSAGAAPLRVWHTARAE